MFRNLFKGIGSFAKSIVISKIFEKKTKLHRELDEFGKKHSIPNEAMDSLRNKFNKWSDELVEQINEI